jgi:hypothetical protein
MAPTIGIEAVPLGARVTGADLLGPLLTLLASILASIDPTLTVDSHSGGYLIRNGQGALMQAGRAYMSLNL